METAFPTVFRGFFLEGNEFSFRQIVSEKYWQNTSWLEGLTLNTQDFGAGTTKLPRKTNTKRGWRSEGASAYR